MNVTEVRVKMVNDGVERLRAFCSVTLDGAFVIRDLKIIDGANGPFVAMPSRKLSDRCAKCGFKNHLRARFCNDCGARLNENRAPRDEDGRVKLHADIAHPINAECRDLIQQAVIEAFERELELSSDPAYAPAEYEEVDDHANDLSDFDDLIAELREDRRRVSLGDNDGSASHAAARQHREVSSRPAATASAERFDRRTQPPPANGRRSHRGDVPRDKRRDDRENSGKVPQHAAALAQREGEIPTHNRREVPAPRVASNDCPREQGRPDESPDSFSAGIL